jgi:hypothetical protein
MYGGTPLTNIIPMSLLLNLGLETGSPYRFYFVSLGPSKQMPGSTLNQATTATSIPFPILYSLIILSFDSISLILGLSHDFSHSHAAPKTPATEKSR